MKWVGLTGGLASGKSTVAGMLRTKGYPVIDADEIAKSVVAPGTQGQWSLRKVFGADIVKPDGELDRAKLASRVFTDAKLLAQLEGVIHPLVQAEVANRRHLFAQQGFRLCFYDVPLLFEKNLTGFDHVVVVTASEENQKLRAKARNNWEDEEIERRLKVQTPLSVKELKADLVIHNDGTMKELEEQVDAVIAKLV